MVLARTRKGDQRRGEFHFRIVPTECDRLLDHRVAVHARCWIRIHTHTVRHVWQVLPEPLLVSFYKVAGVEPRQRIGMAGRFRSSGSSVKPRKQLLRCDGISACIKRSAAQRFHAHEHRRVRLQNLERVPCQILCVIVLRAAEVPTVACQGQRFCLSNFKRVTDEGWSRLRHIGEKQHCSCEGNEIPNRPNFLRCHCLVSFFPCIACVPTSGAKTLCFRVLLTALSAPTRCVRTCARGTRRRSRANSTTNRAFSRRGA